MLDNISIKVIFVYIYKHKQEVIEMAEEKQEEKQVFKLADGTETPSRAAKIRDMFMEEKKTRSDIAKELEVLYSIVHSATANMDNGTVGQRGRVMVELEDGKQIPRTDYIRQQLEEGRTRGDIAKELDIAYGTVYAASKGMDIPGGGGGRKMIEVDGKEMARVDYIRQLFEEGKPRNDIADQITKMSGERCDYSTVWAATKVPKAEAAEGDAAEPADTEK